MKKTIFVLLFIIILLLSFGLYPRKDEKLARSILLHAGYWNIHLSQGNMFLCEMRSSTKFDAMFDHYHRTGTVCGGGIIRPPHVIFDGNFGR